MLVKGKALLEDGIRDVCIETRDGFISKISKAECKGEEILDVSRKGMVILPGMVDIHVHLRDSLLDYKEDFYSGTAAASAGGVVLVYDMPNTKPRTNSIGNLMKRVQIASGKALVDYGLYYGVPDHIRELDGYERYAVGMKIYPEDLDERADLIDKVLKYNSSKNILTVYHPEDPLLIDNTHPLKAELSAAYKISLTSKKYGLKTHLTHISSASTYHIIKRFNEMITVDTCPHYLFLSREKYRGKYYNVTPPLRDENTRYELLKLFTDGKIDVLSTDHAPHTSEEKYIHGVNGFPGLETALPLLLNLYNDGLITLNDIVRLYSYNPAKIFGLDHLYGSIKVGKYASLTIVDLDRSYRIDSSRFHSKAKHSPFDGWMVKGYVYATIVRGRLVYRDGEILLKKGIGLNVREYMRGSNDKES